MDNTTALTGSGILYQISKDGNTISYEFDGYKSNFAGISTTTSGTITFVHASFYSDKIDETVILKEEPSFLLKAFKERFKNIMT